MPNTTAEKLDLLQKTTGLPNVPRETLETLEEFSALLLKWNQKINLVSKKITIDELWHRHILDSAQLIKYIPKNKNEIVDFGSGAGFPALILAIIGGYKVSLIESDQRKCAFMQEASAKLSLHANIFTSRIEDAKSFDADIITSRALASLVKLFDYSEKFVKKDNIMLFLKGQNVVEEIKEASIYWGFSYEIFPDAFNNEACVLSISNLRRL